MLKNITEKEYKYICAAPEENKFTFFAPLDTQSTHNLTAKQVDFTC